MRLGNLAVALKTLGFWSFNNRLCLNERKLEMIHITSKFRNTDSFPDLVTGDGSLKGSEYVLDLGVLIDNNLIFQQQIKNVCKSASFGIVKIGKTRKLRNQPMPLYPPTLIVVINFFFLAFLIHTYFHIKEFRILLLGLLLSRENLST